MELRNQLDQYILDPEIFSPEDQARSELAAMLPEADAQMVASHLNLYAYGSELMKDNNSVQTDYGLLERRDGQPIQAKILLYSENQKRIHFTFNSLVPP